MRTTTISLTLICMLAACAAPTPAPFAARTSLTGEWLGGFARPDGSIASISLKFDASENTLAIEPKVKRWPLTIVTQDDSNVHYTVAGKTGADFEKVEFSGRLSNGVLAGEINWDGQAASITFSPIYDMDPSLFEKYAGLYTFKSGRALSIIQSPTYEQDGLQYFHEGLMLTDFSSGDLRGIYPLDEKTFSVGALRVVGAPLAGRIQFITDDGGQPTGLMWWDDLDGITPATDSGRYAARVAIRVEDVTFTSEDGAILAGRVTSPETTGPHAAFMMLHGSEPGVKDGFGQQVLAHFMISQGIALLTYDKRGVRDSEGVYSERPTPANIDLIASDAVAGADYLSTRPEIDPLRIGLIGGSQAGWVIPVAAIHSNRVSFFVIQSGPVVSFAQEDRYSSVTNDGDTATTYDAEKLDQTLREMKPGGVDPVPVIAELRQPGLWLWGSVDKNVPFKVSAENLQALIDSGKDNFSYIILPHGDHNLNETENGYFEEIPYSPRVLFYSALTDWLEINVLKGK